jgi:hypothetical protein
LTEIVAAGDAMEHSVFTPEELRGGLAILVAYSHLAVREGLYAVSETTRKSFDRAYPRTSSFKQLMDAFAKYLDAEPYPAPGYNEEWRQWSALAPSETDVFAAIEAYIHSYDGPSRVQVALQRAGSLWARMLKRP